MPSWLKVSTCADELSYIFFGETDCFLHNLRNNDDFQPKSWQYDMADYMITMWTNFAKTGLAFEA